MSLLTAQIDSAFREIAAALEAAGAVAFTKTELKQAIVDAEAWAELPATKSDYNAALTGGNFKATATANQKRLVLIWALWSIVKT